MYDASFIAKTQDQNPVLPSACDMSPNQPSTLNVFLRTWAIANNVGSSGKNVVIAPLVIGITAWTLSDIGGQQSVESSDDHHGHLPPCFLGIMLDLESGSDGKGLCWVRTLSTSEHVRI